MGGRGRGAKRDDYNTPWYKKKYAYTRYLEKGTPLEVTEAIAKGLQNWRELTDTEKDLWFDAKATLESKNKKREFWITFYDYHDLDNGRISLQIEVLHIDHVGFRYLYEAPNQQELDRNFWPTVQKLIAHYMSPRQIKTPAKPELPANYRPGADGGDAAAAP